MNYYSLPKIDLHCHIDGSVRIKTIRDLAREEGMDLPENLEKWLIAPDTCGSLDEYLTCFDWPNKVMQRKDAIKRITFEVFEDAALENVKYLEVRFGPLLHLEKGLSIEEVIQSVVEGMEKAKSQYDIEGGIIISILKTMAFEQINDVIDAASLFLDRGVVAMDLAGSELPGFSYNFIPYIEYAKKKGFHVTIHAGENGCGQNVTDAIVLLHAERIGHGIYISNDSKAYTLTKEQKVLLEICPTSNIQTKGVKSIETHPIKDFYDDSIMVSINTDNRSVSNTTMTKEIKLTMETFQMKLEDYFRIYAYAVSKAFTTDEIKEKLLSHIQK
ncbi:MAG: adenosine deaminase [Clostridia bacterium]|nr:adenosine deaminase [Clostridia bacterium]